MVHMIYGREYEIKEPTIRHSRDKKRSQARILVKGFNKADGTPIRFKSLERAENHLKNILKRSD